MTSRFAIQLFLMASLAWSATMRVAQGAHLEAGNSMYRVSISNGERSGRELMRGLYTAFGGEAHPASVLIGRPAAMLELHRDCFTCGGEANYGLFVVRSHDSGWDYTLGSNRTFFNDPEPGRSCVSANDLTDAHLEEVVEAGRAVGLRASWTVRNREDDLEIVESLRVHGEDWIGSAVEVTLRVRNLGTETAMLGARAAWHLRTSGADATAGQAVLGLRPPDPPIASFSRLETEWERPDFRMWEAHGHEPPRLYPHPYSIAGTVSGLSRTLDPAPTPPDMFQFGEVHPTSRASSGGGAYSRCFEWRIPAPPRDYDSIDFSGVVYYWGLDPADALVVPPGEEVRITQYLVAFIDYPISAEAEGPFEADCTGPVTEVPLAGRALLIDTTTAPVVHLWSSSDPAVSFTDPSSPTTRAVVAGAGTFPVRLTVAVGAYEASVDTTVSVRDERPPELDLSVSPNELWPPDHRWVDVQVAAELVDDCDPAPELELVAVEVDEGALERGSGRTEDDVEGAELGASDLDLRLRAERSGRRLGRSYRLIYAATDWAGNLTVEEVQVRVPHDRAGLGGGGQP